MEKPETEVSPRKMPYTVLFQPDVRGQTSGKSLRRPGTEHLQLGRTLPCGSPSLLCTTVITQIKAHSYKKDKESTSNKNQVSRAWPHNVTDQYAYKNVPQIEISLEVISPVI